MDDGNKVPPHEDEKGHSDLGRQNTPSKRSLFSWAGQMLHTFRFKKSRSQKVDAAMEDIRKAFRHINPKRAVMLLMLGIVGIYVLTGIYVVNPGEQAVIRRFGALLVKPVSEGIHYRLPWPIDEVQKINVSEVRRADVGMSLPEHMHSVDTPEPVQLLTGDENIITTEAIVHYKINDAAKFLYNVNSNDELLVRGRAEVALVEVMANMSVDDVLSTGKVQDQNSSIERAQECQDND